jgi:hypothetical protein
MANNCYNHAALLGKKEMLDLFVINMMLALKDEKHLWYETFYTALGQTPPEKEKDSYEEFGSRWFDVYLERQHDNVLMVSGDSAWSPVSEFFLKVSEVYNLKIESCYEEGGNDIGGWFNCENGVVTKEVDTTADEFNYKEDPDAFLNSKEDAISCGDYDDEIDDPTSIGSIYDEMTSKDKQFIIECFQKRRKEILEN